MLNTTTTEALLSVLRPKHDADTRAQIMAEIALPATRMGARKAVIGAVGEHGSTDDIVSEAIVRAIEKIDLFDWTMGSVSSWVNQIARNTARNWVKASANRGHFSEVTTGDDDDAETVDLTDSLVGEDGRFTVERQSEMRALRAAMADLDQDSQTFLDAMAGGATMGEAGALLGWSPATSTRRYKAITERLADAL
jgi:RNA polymerase sigma factor (sigma-70 family)